MPTKNVNLSEQQTKFIRKSVHGGHYRNASEVVRAGLRLLEQRDREDQLKLEGLRGMVKQGFDEIDRGEYEKIGAGEIDQFMARVDARVRASKKR